MSTRKNRQRRVTLSEHTANVTSAENQFLPPGSGEQVVEEQPATGGEPYPAVTIVDGEEHAAQEAKAAEERVERAKQVSSPKRLSQQEMLNMKLLLDLMPGGEEAPLNTPIPLESLPVELSQSFFATGATRNMAQRNLVKLLVNPETKQPDALEITEIGFAVYQSQSKKGSGATPQKRTTKADGTPRAVGGRASNKFDGLRLKILADNPRDEGTMGYFSWQLYRDGMTYKEYMACKDYPEQYSKRTNEKFRGPGRNHWEWDLLHGFIGLYRDGEEELLEDGSPNPRYWAINNNVH
jgi:hypothetical protein